MVKVLVACEESQAVCIAFRNKGHEAYSCDIEPCSGGHPEWHIQGDVLPILNDGWDMMIGHPPCTYLCVPGAHYLHTRPNRWALMLDAKNFFMTLLNANIPLRAIENPVPHRYAELPKYTQIIQPWQYGHEVSKRTCLWLLGLPKLISTDIRGNKGERYIRTERQQQKYGKVSNSKWYARSTAKERSKTFPGIAQAMAEQWG
jgi:hypothetical protein